MPILRPFKLGLVIPIYVLALGTPLLHADLTSIYLFSNAYWFQTSASAPTGLPAGYFFNLGATEQNAGDFDSISVTYPGPGSPQVLNFNPGSASPGFGSPGYPDLASYQAAYPFGTYTFNGIVGGVTTQTENLNYAGDYYASAIPALSAATYNGLQGLAPNSSLTIGFNSFTPDPNASGGSPFFTISNTSTGIAAFSVGLPYGDTSVNLPAGTLAANTNYTWELDFSDRLNGQTADGVFTTQGFDLRTDGSFTTGAFAPEPGFVGPLVFGLGLLGVAMLRRRTRRAATGSCA